LYVSNGNFSTEFDGGTIVALDIVQADADGVACRAALDAGTPAPDGCQAVRGLPASLCQTNAAGRCDTSQRAVPYIDKEATVEISSFPGDFTPSPDGSRLYFTVRGDQSLSFIDIRPDLSGAGAIECEAVPSGENGAPHCAGGHVLLADRQSELPELGTLVPGFAEGAFSVAIDQGRNIPGAGVNDLLYVSHLDTGFVSLFRTTPDGRLIFQRSQALGIGVNQAAVHPQTGFLYVARRDVNLNGATVVGTRIDMIKTLPDPGDASKLAMVLDDVFSPANIPAGASDYRSLAFGEGGDRLYVGARNPSSVIVFDTSLGSDGLAKNDLIGRVDVDLSPQQLRVVQLSDGRELVYAVDFENARVHIVDPEFLDSGTARGAIDVGQGPFGAAFATVNGAPRLFVVNFVEDTISAVDLDPASPTFHQELYRIGAPRPAEEDN
jgi:DNA-binding beta-propeller fold protein YncE